MIYKKFYLEFGKKKNQNGLSNDMSCPNKMKEQS